MFARVRLAWEQATADQSRFKAAYDDRRFWYKDAGFNPAPQFNKLSMSEKYKNKTCVYCMTTNSSEDGDHVVSREFFLPEKRAGLPKVPACKACNNAKATLEHYLTAVMPFGGRHVGFKQEPVDFGSAATGEEYEALRCAQARHEKWDRKAQWGPLGARDDRPHRQRATHSTL